MDLLSAIELTELSQLEERIERGLRTFVEVGTALLRIRDGRLYRDHHATFEDYCKERWGMVRRQADRLIQAAEVTENLRPAGLILPGSERQTRPLTTLDPEDQITAWSRAVELAENGNGKITGQVVEKAVEEIRDFNYKRDSRRSSPQDIYTPQGMDACQTPPYAIDPLLPYLDPDWVIWEPAAGEGMLEGAFYDSGMRVVPTDILTGQNFFEYEPESWDCLVTNPPFSIKYQWLERCYELSKPFALLVPVETLGAKTAQELMKAYGFEIMLLDKRIDFKMPNKGFEGSAPFPVFWLCWQLLPEPVMFGEVIKDAATL